MKLRALILAIGVMLSGAVGVLAMPTMVYADNEDEKTKTEGSGQVACPEGSKRKTAPTYADCNLPETLPTKDVPTTAQTIINVLVSAVGIISVAVIVIGGILYVTSTGDTAKTKRAQNAILYGVVGLVVAVLAYAIVNFVLKSVF